MLTLEQLGFTKEELQQRVIDQLCKQALVGVSYDEDGNEAECDSQFSRRLNDAIKKRIDETINAIAEKSVLPNVASYIENLSLQETNKWGEKHGAPVTFIEYLVGRAEAYLQEPVNYEGKAKREGDSYSWKGTQTRLVHLVHEHLHHSISTAMKEAMAVANSQIASGIQETVKLKLAEISTALSVKTETKAK